MTGKRLLAGIVTVLAVGLAAVPAVTAAPMSHQPNVTAQAGWRHTPKGLTWHFLNSQAPPTTADCLRDVGVRCYSPSQFQTAYDMKRLFAAGDAGQGRTIVLVDSFGSPTIKHDLAVFDHGFGLPAPPSFRVMQPAGKVPPFDPNNGDMVGWAIESTLDVQMAHLMAPKANLVLAETPVSETQGVQGFPQIEKAENVLINRGIGDVFSMSFGSAEEDFPSHAALLGLRSALVNARRHHISMLSSTGDTGSTTYKLDFVHFWRHPVMSWPASDPLVTAVGGTQLTLNGAGHRLMPDNVWNDIPSGFDAAGGGGPSHVFSRPGYQDGIHAEGHYRATPDISLSASVTGSALAFSSFQPFGPGYFLVGGTSEASPLFAGLVAVADETAGHRLGLLNPALYRLGIGHGSGIVDVTKGTNTFLVEDSNGGALFSVPGWNAGRGYDMASGVGTVDGYRLVHALAQR
jgi:subtilase family serine protease